MLRANQVHVWWADPDELVEDRRSIDMLSADELRRLAGFHFDHDRALYLATRVMVRTALSRYLAVAPEAWRFAANAYGRPMIDPTSSLRFNLSNTRGLVVCAMAWDADIGVDAELVTRAAPLDVAERYFAASEVASLRALEPRAQQRRFFDYWTLKESYIKARGLGLTIPLDRFSIHFDVSSPRITIDPSLDDDGAMWQLEQHRPSHRHVISLCVRRPHLKRDLDVCWFHHESERFVRTHVSGADTIQI